MVARLRAVTIAFVLAIAMATAAPPASAQPSKPAVELLGDRGSLDRAKLDELVTLELGAEAARVTRVVIDVSGGRASVDVVLGDEHRTASVALAAAEPERALALFVAELARGASPPAPPAPPAPPPAPPVPPPPPAPSAEPPARSPAPSAPPGRPWRFSLLGTMGARVMTTDGALLPTPKLEIGARQDDGLRLGATVRYGYASASDPLGTVRAHAVAGGLAATYVIVSSERLALAAGPRFELGLVAGRGDGANGASTTALTFGGSLELELHVKLGGVSLLGALEGGALRGVVLRADDREVLHLSGPFVGFALGAML